MRTTRTQLGVLVLLAVFSTAATAGGPLLVPTAQTRSISGTAYAEDDFGGPFNDSDSDSAPDFALYNGAAAANADVDGASGSGGGQQTSEILANGILAEGSMFATGETWDFNAFADGSSQVLMSVTFDVTAQTDWVLQGTIAAFDNGLAEVSLLEGAIEIFGTVIGGPATTLPVNETGTLQPGPHTLLIRLEASVFGGDFFSEYASADFDLDFLLGAGGTGGEVPDGDDVAGTPLRVEKLTGGDVRLSWTPSCRLGDADFAVYEGDLANPSVLAPVTCSTTGAAQWDVSPVYAGSYFLVVPHDGVTEGSYGDDRDGVERLPSGSACRTQVLGAPVCP